MIMKKTILLNLLNSNLIDPETTFRYLNKLGTGLLNVTVQDAFGKKARHPFIKRCRATNSK